MVTLNIKILLIYQYCFFYLIIQIYLLFFLTMSYNNNMFCFLELNNEIAVFQMKGNNLSLLLHLAKLNSLWIVMLWTMATTNHKHCVITTFMFD